MVDEKDRLREWHESHGLKVAPLSRRAVEELYERGEAEGWSEERKREEAEALMRSTIEAAEGQSDATDKPAA
jgi:broad-specificity NMP kinase